MPTCNDTHNSNVNKQKAEDADLDKLMFEMNEFVDQYSPH